MTKPFQIDARLKLVFREQEADDLDGLTVPGTDDQLCIVESGHPCYQSSWEFYLVRSGVQVKVWDERPERPAASGSGRREDEQEYVACGLCRALVDGEDLFRSATAAGIPTHSDDPAMVKEALARVAFVVVGTHGILCRPFAAPKRKPRRLTQKRLDGGEDMTV